LVKVKLNLSYKPLLAASEPLLCSSLPPMKKPFLLALLCALGWCQAFGQAAATAHTPAATAAPLVHPAWIMQGNIYEVNVRQYTPEGTLNAFAKHLDRLKEMGVQTLWFMPLNPISKVARNGSTPSLAPWPTGSGWCKPFMRAA
jgi:hypothetical protein